VGPINFQVSELAKVLVLIWICSYCVRKRAELETTLPGLAKPVGLLVVAAILLLCEPDFGATTVLFATGFAVLFVAGARLRYVLLLVSAAALSFAVLALTSAYRLKRLTGFLHPWDDPFNGGFQLTQSLIAIGRGSWFGVGLGSSVQKLFYLPEAHTDFVFAVLAEELGLVGVLGVIALFMALVWRAFQISRMAAQSGMRFQAYLALAFGVWLGLQASVNIGVNMGVLPTKGLTLPLLSYGRSSLLVSLGWLGVVLRIYHEAKLSSRSAVMRIPGGGR
jgi:cell division protein FtsW